MKATHATTHPMKTNFEVKRATKRWLTKKTDSKVTHARKPPKGDICYEKRLGGD